MKKGLLTLVFALVGAGAFYYWGAGNDADNNADINKGKAPELNDQKGRTDVSTQKPAPEPTFTELHKKAVSAETNEAESAYFKKDGHLIIKSTSAEEYQLAKNNLDAIAEFRADNPDLSEKYGAVLDKLERCHKFRMLTRSPDSAIIESEEIHHKYFAIQNDAYKLYNLPQNKELRDLLAPVIAQKNSHMQTIWGTKEDAAKEPVVVKDPFPEITTQSVDTSKKQKFKPLF